MSEIGTKRNVHNDDSGESEREIKHQKRSFKDLIHSRRQGNRNLSETSREVLHEAVFQLINLHQDTAKLVHETLTSCSPQENSTEQREPKEFLFTNVLNSLSQLNSQPDQSVSLTVTEECARRLLACGRSRSEVPKSDIQEENDLKLCLRQINTVIKEDKFNKQHFVNLLTREKILPPKTLWCLHTENLLPLLTYLTMKMTEPGFVHTFSVQLGELCREEELKGEQGIMSCLINSGFPEKKEKEASLRRVAVAILDTTIKSFLDESDDDTVLQPFIGKTFTENTLNPLSFKKYCTHTMSLLMSHKPSLKVSQAFKQQSNWKFAKISEKIADLYKQLFLPFESGEILEVLQRVLERQEVNWRTVLSFIATFLLCYQDGAKLIQGHVHNLLCKGLEESDMESTIIAFLLARQSCLEGLHVFPQYQDWFQQTFSDANRTPAASRKSFSFLMNFLTNIVPYEAAPHLKVHVLRPPHIPAKCRELFTEYVTLAKTRLTDLKESCENIGGIYDSGADTGNKQTDQVETDVERSLTAFQLTGKVPSTVMEASIFRKPYFVGKYLKSLLTPRHLPDKPDTRMKMIESLKKADKIPASMYSRYEEACRKESKLLLEGVFDVDSEDDAMQEGMLTPIEQLKFRLDQLNKIVMEESKQKPVCSKLKVPEVVSIISEKLESLLSSKHAPQPDLITSEICININKPDLSQHQLKVVDALLNGICQTVTSDLSAASPNMSWLTQIVKMLSQHKTLHRPLVQRVFHLVLLQGSDLSDQHMTGLSALVAQVSSLHKLFGPITVKHCNQHGDKSSNSLIDSLLHGFGLRSGSDIRISLWFMTTYLEHVFLNYTCHTCVASGDETVGVVPEYLVKLFCVLCWRLVPATRHSVEPRVRSGAVVTIFHSHVYQELLDKSQVSFEEWTQLEINVLPEEDILSFAERQMYFNWAVYTHFLAGGEDVCNICSTLLDTLVNQEISRNREVDLYPRCCKCSKGGNSGRDSCNAFLTLLQSVLTHLPPCNSVSWLTGYLERVILHTEETGGENGENSRISTQTKVIALFSYICCLPPFLLLVNKLTDTPTDLTASRLASVMENLLAPYLSEGPHLSPHLTLYLVQSLRYFPSDDRLIREQLQHPLVAVSILVHWSVVKNVLSEDEQKENKVMREFDVVNAWAERCIETGDIEPSSSPLWLCGASLFAASQSQHDKIESITSVLSTEGKDSKIVSVYVELTTLHLAAKYSELELIEEHLQESASEKLKNSVSNLLKTFPNLIKQVDEDSGLEPRVASLGARTFKKAILLLLVCQVDIGDVIAMVTDCPQILVVLIKLYNQVCLQFQQAAHGQCPSLVQLSKWAEYLKRVLENVNIKFLQLLDQEDLRQGGSDFHHLVMSRLRNNR